MTSREDPSQRLPSPHQTGLDGAARHTQALGRVVDAETLDVHELDRLAIGHGQVHQGVPQKPCAFVGLEARACARSGVGDLRRHLRPSALLATSTDVVDRVVGRQPVQPGGERVIRPEPVEVAVQLDEHLAHHVLEVGLPDAVTPRHRGDHPLVRLDEILEGPGITGHRSLDQRAIGRRSVLHGISRHLRGTASSPDGSLESASYHSDPAIRPEDALCQRVASAERFVHRRPGGVCARAARGL